MPLLATPADLVAYCEYAQVPQAVIDDQSIRIANSVASISAQLQASIEGTANLSNSTFLKLREVVGSDSNDEAATAGLRHLAHRNGIFKTIWQPIARNSKKRGC